MRLDGGSVPRAQGIDQPSRPRCVAPPSGSPSRSRCSPASRRRRSSSRPRSTPARSMRSSGSGNARAGCGRRTPASSSRTRSNSERASSRAPTTSGGSTSATAPVDGASRSPGPPGRLACHAGDRRPRRRTGRLLGRDGGSRRGRRPFGATSPVGDRVPLRDASVHARPHRLELGSQRSRPLGSVPASGLVSGQVAWHLPTARIWHPGVIAGGHLIASGLTGSPARSCESLSTGSGCSPPRARSSTNRDRSSGRGGPRGATVRRGDRTCEGGLRRGDPPSRGERNRR